MAISLANYPQTSETSKLSEYDDEKVSLVSFLPSHTKQPRLPIFETVIPQQNGSLTNKNTLSFNKRNSFPRSVPRNSSYTTMCGDLPSQQANCNSINKSSVKMRRRAASFGENSVECNNYSNKYNNNINGNKLTTAGIENDYYTTSLIIHIPSKVDKVESPRLSPRSLKPSPEEKSKGKSWTENSLKSTTTKNHNIEQKQEILDNNKVEASNNNQNQNENELEKSIVSDNNEKSQNNNIENNNTENPQLISNNNSNSDLITQNSKHNRSFFRHNIILNHQAGGSSTDLRKSMYKEPSFKKRLRKVFSLTNIRQDNNNNSSKTNSTPSSVSSFKFSSLRGEKHNFTVDNDDNSSNNDKDDNTSVSSVSSNNDATTQEINNHNKSSSRRRSIIGIFSSKNEKKRNKQKQQQRYLEEQQSLSPSLDQQNEQLNDNKRNNSIDDMKENDNNEEKQQNDNGNDGNDDDPDKKSSIPSQLSSLQSLDNDSPNQFKQQNSTSPLFNQFPVNKSPSRPSSLPAPAKDKEPSSSTTTPRRLSVPAPPIVKSENNNNQPKPPFANLGANGTRSVPSLVLLKDTDIPSTPSTPSSIKKLQFSSKILIHETWTREDYDRRGDQSTCNKLTPTLAQKIKEELNEYKTVEMQVHEDSKNNTHYFA